MNFWTSSEPDTLMKVQSVWWATALASRVFPVPGGPYNSTPCVHSKHESEWMTHNQNCSTINHFSHFSGNNYSLSGCIFFFFKTCWIAAIVCFISLKLINFTHLKQSTQALVYCGGHLFTIIVWTKRWTEKINWLIDYENDLWLWRRPCP